MCICEFISLYEHSHKGQILQVLLLFQSYHRKFSYRRICPQRELHVEHQISKRLICCLLFLFFPFLLLISTYCLYLPPPANVFPLFLSNAFFPFLVLCILTCEALPYSSFIMWSEDVTQKSSLFICSFVCASKAIKKASLVTLNTSSTAPWSRSCSAAAGTECVWEGSDLLMHVPGALGVHRVTSLLDRARTT